MKREFATLAHSYHGNFEKVIGWYISRKLNGWGCLWDGGVTRGLPAYKIPFYYIGGDNRPIKSTGLWTIGRSNKYGIRPKTIQAPDWFLDMLPKDVPLQGEIWKDDNLSDIKSICGCSTEIKKSDPRWKDVKFFVYNYKPFSLWEIDCYKNTSGQVTGDVEIGLRFEKLVDSAFYKNVPLEERIDNLSKVILTKDYVESPVRLLPFFKIETLKDFALHSELVKANRWEGSMLANPRTFYECSRSHNLLKVKPKFDAEARIIGHLPGKTGKNIGKMGAISCMLTWGEEVMSITGGTKEMIGKTVYFSVSGMSDADRDWLIAEKKYPVNSMLSFTFSCISTHGVPSSCNVVN